MRHPTFEQVAEGESWVRISRSTGPIKSLGSSPSPITNIVLPFPKINRNATTATRQRHMRTRRFPHKQSSRQTHLCRYPIFFEILLHLLFSSYYPSKEKVSRMAGSNPISAILIIIITIFCMLVQCQSPQLLLPANIQDSPTCWCFHDCGLWR